MTAKVNSLGRYRNDVSNALFDITVAAGAEVGLPGLVWLHKIGLRFGPEVDWGALSHATQCARSSATTKAPFAGRDSAALQRWQIARHLIR